MSELAEVKRVRMSAQDVDMNSQDGKPVLCLVIEIPLVDFTPSKGRLTELWEESYTNKQKREIWSTIVARIGDRFGKISKDLESVKLPDGGDLKGYSFKLQLKAPKVVTPKAVEKPVVEDDDFGANYAPMGGHSQDVHAEAIGSLQGMDKEELKQAVQELDDDVKARGKVIRANGKQ